MLKPVIFIVGPTGVGKTAVSIDLAKQLKSEIVSADSMQIYRGMDIGTAKVTSQEMSGIQHHLVNICDVNEEFTAQDFCNRAFDALDLIFKRSSVAIVVGGTGLYVKAMIEGLAEQPSSDERIRKRLEEEALIIGPEKMHARLREVDSVRAEDIHPNQLRRVIRALEIYEISKIPASLNKHKKKSMIEKGYQPILLGLTMDRTKLYGRIDKRVEQMFEAGLLEEVLTLMPKGLSKTARQAVGYKEILNFIEERTLKTVEQKDLCMIKELIQQKSRNLAKRQWTWFKKEKNIQWFDWDCYENKENLLQAMLEKINLKSA